MKKLYHRTGHQQAARSGSASQPRSERGGYLPVIQYQQTSLLSLAEGIRWDPDGSSAPVKGTGERENPAEEAGGGSLTGQFDPAGDGPGKLISPTRRRQTLGIPPTGKRESTLRTKLRFEKTALYRTRKHLRGCETQYGFPKIPFARPGESQDGVGFDLHYP